MTQLNYFWDERLMRDVEQRTPTILAIGDSWFWYPFLGGSLVNNLGDLMPQQVIFAKGMNVAEAFDYVDGKYAVQVRQALRLHGRGLQAVFISGGGNDFAGFNDMRPLLKGDCRDVNNAVGCFEPGPNGIDGFLEHIDTYYRKLIGVIYTYTTPDCRIVMHNYDYAIPDGRGVFAGAEGWLRPALAAAGVKDALQPECVRYLIDRFTAVLKAIRDNDPRHLFLVDSRGTLKPEEWANELHPTAAGFRRIAQERWQPVLAAAGLTT